MNSRMNHSAKSSRLVSLALLLLLLCGLVPAWAQNGARQISQLVLPLHDRPHRADRRTGPGSYGPYGGR